jgi:hypothetical protein
LLSPSCLSRVRPKGQLERQRCMSWPSVQSRVQVAIIHPVLTVFLQRNEVPADGSRSNIVTRSCRHFVHEFDSQASGSLWRVMTADKRIYLELDKPLVRPSQNCSTPSLPRTGSHSEAAGAERRFPLLSPHANRLCSTVHPNAKHKVPGPATPPPVR